MVSIFLKFSLVFLAAEEDYKTYKQKQSEVNELTTTYAGVLRHAQQQDKLNAKRLIHGICSIFRLFLYQINTKFVLTVSRRIHFLSSIHQHLNKAPQKKKTSKCEETRRHLDATTATLQQNRFVVIRKHFGGNSTDFAVYLCVLRVSSNHHRK